MARPLLPVEGMETIVPSQFFLSPRDTQPEKRLMAAVLEEAIHTFQSLVGREGRRARKRLAEVEDWFASDDRSSAFTFLRLCEALGLEPGWIRFGLSRWRDRRRDSHEAAGPAVRPRRPRGRGHPAGEHRLAS